MLWACLAMRRRSVHRSGPCLRVCDACCSCTHSLLPMTLLPRALCLSLTHSLTHSHSLTLTHTHSQSCTVTHPMPATENLSDACCARAASSTCASGLQRAATSSCCSLTHTSEAALQRETTRCHCAARTAAASGRCCSSARCAVLRCAELLARACGHAPSSPVWLPACHRVCLLNCRLDISDEFKQVISTLRGHDDKVWVPVGARVYVCMCMCVYVCVHV